MKEIDNTIFEKVTGYLADNDIDIYKPLIYRIVDYSLAYAIDSNLNNKNSPNELIVLRKSYFSLNSSEYKSTKNLFLNFKSLMYNVSIATLSVISAIENLWLIPFTFIVLCKEINDSITISIKKNSALLLLTIWELEFKEKTFLSLHDLYKKVKNQGIKISKKEFNYEIKNLEKLGIISVTKEVKLVDKIKLC